MVNQHGGSPDLVAVHLAEVLLLTARADEAWQALQIAPEDLPLLNSDLFEYLLRRTQAAEATGRSEEAISAARAALKLIDAPDQFRRHRGVGAVTVDEETRGYLQATV